MHALAVLDGRRFGRLLARLRTVPARLILQLPWLGLLAAALAAGAGRRWE